MERMAEIAVSDAISQFRLRYKLEINILRDIHRLWAGFCQIRGKECVNSVSHSGRVGI